mmetsp:Transcript_859/g.1436  ORF Transcript_859/g.1436 Transcript_859/m.1436 type:complete len:203 (-) Transcript_859:2388-2996(-)
MLSAAAAASCSLSVQSILAWRNFSFSSFSAACFFASSARARSSCSFSSRSFLALFSAKRFSRRSLPPWILAASPSSRFLSSFSNISWRRCTFRWFASSSARVLRARSVSNAASRAAAAAASNSFSRAASSAASISCACFSSSSVSNFDVSDSSLFCMGSTASASTSETSISSTTESSCFFLLAFLFSLDFKLEHWALRSEAS